MSAIEVRPFRRDDREQLTGLVNAHVPAVVPGMSVSVNRVMSQLERDPGEFIVDPWVSERATLVAEQRRRIVACGCRIFGLARQSQLIRGGRSGSSAPLPAIRLLSPARSAIRAREPLIRRYPIRGTARPLRDPNRQCSTPPGLCCSASASASATRSIAVGPAVSRPPRHTAQILQNG
jgi:hypothetical protein